MTNILWAQRTKYFTPANNILFKQGILRKFFKMCNSIILRNLLILENNRWLSTEKVYWNRRILVDLRINKHYIIKSTHSMEQSPSWEASQFSASQEIPALYGTWRFITMITSAHQLSLSWASSTQSKLPHPNSWRSILIWSSHLCLSRPRGLLPSGSPSKTLHVPLLSPIHAPCPVHLQLLDLITLITFGDE